MSNAYIAGSPIGSGRPQYAYAPRMPTASGGTAPYTFTLELTNVQTGADITPADLGLTFDGTANPPTLTGTPCATNTPSACPIQGFMDSFRATLTVKDSASPKASVVKTATMIIEADTQPQFAADEVSHTFAVGRREAWQIPVPTGGNLAYSGSHWKVTSANKGKLSRNNWGLEIVGTSGHIHGTPKQAESETEFTITVTDRDGETDTIKVKLTIEDATAPRFTDNSITVLWYYKWKDGQGWPYSGNLDNAQNPSVRVQRAALPGAGGSNTTYTLTGLPAGMAYDATTNELTGAPTEKGTFNLRLKATNDRNQTDTMTVKLVVMTAQEPRLGGSALTCTQVRLSWSMTQKSNPIYSEVDAPTITGYRIEGKRLGESAWRELVKNHPTATTNYTHNVRAGSTWAYRVAAITADGQGVWSTVRTVSTTRNSADPRSSRVREAGMVQTLSLSTSFSGVSTVNLRYQSATDALPLVWRNVPTWSLDGSAAHTYTAADVGKLLRLTWDRERAHPSDPDSLGQPDEANSLPLLRFTDPIVADESPSYGRAWRIYDSVKAGDPVPFSLAATGGSAPMTYTISPALPTGLTVNTTTGAITGTPASDWRGTHTVTARDADCDQASFTAYVGTSPIPEGVPLRVTASVAGLVPPGTRFTVGYSCPGLGGAFHIWPGESRYAYVPHGSPCSLTISDDGGARTVSGTFENRRFTYETYVPLLFDFTEPAPEPEPQPEPEPEPEPEPAVATVETRVWQSVRDPERLWLSARVEGGSWATLGTVRLPLEQSLIPGGRFLATTVTLDAPIGGDNGDSGDSNGGDSGDGDNGDDDNNATVTIEVRVVRDNEIGAVYINARPEDGPWASKMALTVDFDGLSRSERYRYGDTAIEVPLEDAAADAPAVAAAR